MTDAEITAAGIGGLTGLIAGFILGSMFIIQVLNKKLKALHLTLKDTKGRSC